MPSKDLHSNIGIAVALKPITSTTGAHAGEIVDTDGFDSCVFVIETGDMTDGTQTPSVEMGDASNLSDTADAASYLHGTIASATFAATDDFKVKKLGYRGPKRYCRLTMTAASATTGGLLSAVAVLGHPHLGPVA